MQSMRQLQAYRRLIGQPQFLLVHLEIPKPEDIDRPGHIFPLKSSEGGVLKRAGHTEASVDLAVLSGLEPVAVLCEVVGDGGPMARLPKLCEFAQWENLKIVSIADLIRVTLEMVKMSLRGHPWNASQETYLDLLDANAATSPHFDAATRRGWQGRVVVPTRARRNNYVPKTYRMTGMTPWKHNLASE